MDSIYEDRVKQTNAQVGGTIVQTVGEDLAKRGQYYLTKYYLHFGEQSNKRGEWESINKLYKCIRDDAGSEEGDPCSFIPILTPIIEGQVANIAEPNMTVSILGAHPGDAMYANMLSSGAQYQRERDNFKSMLKDAVRDYLMFGNVIGYTWWDADDCGGRGTWRNDICPLSNVFFDSRIRDTRRLQKAEYIIHEIGFKSIAWARDEYGDAIADSLVKMNNVYHFDAEYGDDDKDSFGLLHIWTRNNKEHNVQLIEMDKRGLILRQSESNTPYYKKMQNEYPFAMVRMNKVAFSIYGFGDGRILEPLQRTVNRLVDEMEIACRFNAQPRTFVDPKAKMDDEQLDNDPSHVIMATNPNSNIRVVDGHGINQVVMTLLGFLLDQAQKATRFSDLMMGTTSSVSATATQVATTGQQGAIGIGDKRSDIGEFIATMTKQGLCLAREFWDEPFWARMGAHDDEYEYLDFTRLDNVPRLVPASYSYKKSWVSQNPGKSIEDAPKHETVEYDSTADEMDDDGNPLYKQGDIVGQDVMFDIKCTLGEGMPTSKIAVYNIILSLAQLQVMDEATGMPRPLLYYTQVKKMIEGLLGIDIGTFENQQLLQAKQMQAQGYNAGMMGNASGINPISASNPAMPMGSSAKMPPTSQDTTIPGAGMTGGRVQGV